VRLKKQNGPASTEKKSGQKIENITHRDEKSMKNSGEAALEGGKKPSVISRAVGDTASFIIKNKQRARKGEKLKLEGGCRSCGRGV